MVMYGTGQQITGQQIAALRQIDQSRAAVFVGCAGLIEISEEQRKILSGVVKEVFQKLRK